MSTKLIAVVFLITITYTNSRTLPLESTSGSFCDPHRHISPSAHACHCHQYSPLFLSFTYNPHFHHNLLIIDRPTDGLHRLLNCLLLIVFVLAFVPVHRGGSRVKAQRANALHKIKISQGSPLKMLPRIVFSFISTKISTRVWHTNCNEVKTLRNMGSHGCLTEIGCF